MFHSPLLLSSKHLKEQILQPIFATLGLDLIVNHGFDTDAFGTFCGSVPRPDGPQVTVKEKCLAGMAFAGKRQGLASEGSFGVHPSIPLLTINEEWLVYIDLDSGLEIFGRSTSLAVCHLQLDFVAAEELPVFLANCAFGAQGLIFKNTLTGQLIEKGIQEETRLKELMNQYPKWHIETDLRAHMNPTRQKNIQLAAQDLIKRMQSLCPKCTQPDFSVHKLSGKLKCSACLQETTHYKILTYYCKRCHYEQNEERKDKEYEDPQYCNNCNP